MTKKSPAFIPFDQCAINAISYGSTGNAILGIRDSGKTYTATYFAEQLFEAGIPFITFDPIGVWRYLRVPGKGRGYPIVVAGGKEGDLPLTVAGAPEIVRAAMKNGVSLVIDLYDINLSKADWKRIVTACLKVLLHENGEHGLRHVFIEEAAEFAPQRVGPDQGQVYAEMEKLARMGGNAKLGYTLINQRAEEVNKAVLELCDNLFLHRQKGRNSLNALSKWLDIGSVKEGKKIIETLPSLPTGECWAWLAGPDRPERIRVPAKNSLHPDRRITHGADETKRKAAVNVSSFVNTMKSSLVQIEQQMKDNDPGTLKAEIARLNKLLKKGAAPVVDVQAIRVKDYVAFEKLKQEMSNRLGSIENRIGICINDLQSARSWFFEAVKKLKPPESDIQVITEKLVSKPKITVLKDQPLEMKGGNGGVLARPEQKIVDAISWWNALGIETPSRTQVAFVSGYSPTSSSFIKYVSLLSSGGHIFYPGSGTVALTEGGKLQAAVFDEPSYEIARQKILQKLSPAQGKILEALIDLYPAAPTREELAEASGYSATSSSFVKYVSQLSSLDLLTYPSRGQVKAAEWMFES